MRRTKKWKITEEQGRHWICERSTSRGCKIGRQRIQVLWWTDERSQRFFWAGEFIDRNPVGSSSKALSVLVWNLGNWKRGETWLLPSFVDQNKISYKEDKPNKFPDHNKQKQTNMRTVCFFRWWGARRLMWFWSVKLEILSLMTNILRSLVGPYALMMLKIFLV